jgi:hypothetical protein
MPYKSALQTIQTAGCVVESLSNLQHHGAQHARKHWWQSSQQWSQWHGSTQLTKATALKSFVLKSDRVTNVTKKRSVLASMRK